MKLFDTLSRTKQTLKPLNDKHVTMYSCGLTVYSHPHIGNWVGYIYWDVLVRTLEAEGFTVERTQNYTDVGHLTSDDDSGEDKIEKQAKAEGSTAWEIAQKFITIADNEAYKELRLKMPAHLARATDYITEQIHFVETLETKGYTYIIPNEGVYFDTAKLSDYGKLAQLDINGLEAGARVAISGKRNITDFALWKFSPKTAKRDMEWDSPWGKGFPGWHLECSVIAQSTLGNQIDIHTGGIDHIPVHHTNEIAQTEALTDKPFAQMWLHNNHLKVNGAKMSKSLGNIYTLQDITKHGFSIDAFKILVLSKHYRTEGNFTWDILSAAENRLKGLCEAAALQWQPIATVEHNYDFKKWVHAIQSQLADDLSTPAALATLNEQLEQVKQNLIHPSETSAYREYLSNVDNLFGLQLSATPDIPEDAAELLQARHNARTNQNWKQADELRDALANKNIAVRDTPAGQVWYWFSW